MRVLGFLAALVLAFAAGPRAEAYQLLGAPAASSPPGIACSVGPNYTGTIPAAAIKAWGAGNVACVLNFDVSQPQFQNLANWLDCAGAVVPVWYNTGYNTAPTPCSDYSIVTDPTKGPVLDMAYNISDASIGPGTWMSTQNGAVGGTKGLFLPTGAYYQTTLELLPVNVNVFNTSSGNAICDDPGTGSKYCETAAWFAYTNGPPQQEIDFLEMDGLGNIYPNAVANGYIWQSGLNGAPQFSWHTYGNLITHDGSTIIEHCSYNDTANPGTLAGLGCHYNVNQVGNYAYNFTTRSVAGLGPSSGNVFPCSANPGGTCPIPSQPEHLRISQILIFSCLNWQTNMCPGTVVTSP